MSTVNLENARRLTAYIERTCVHAPPHISRPLDGMFEPCIKATLAFLDNRRLKAGTDRLRNGAEKAWFWLEWVLGCPEDVRWYVLGDPPTTSICLSRLADFSEASWGKIDRYAQGELRDAIYETWKKEFVAE